MRFIVLIFFLPVLCIANGSRPLPAVNPIVNHYLHAYSTLDKPESADNQSFVKFFSKLSTSRKFFTSNEEYLRFVFTKVHGKFLRNFDEAASFNDLAINGKYNCLTATALYALALEQLNFKYGVFETSYHIFLTVEIGAQTILLETTDPVNGFISDKKEIAERITQYQSQNFTGAKSNKYYYQFSNSLFHQVNLEGLLGLLHFNSAVKAYNNHDLYKTIDHLERASMLYYSNRLDEFSKVIFLTLLEGKYDAKTREKLLPKINVIKDHKLRSVASLK